MPIRRAVIAGAPSAHTLTQTVVPDAEVPMIRATGLLVVVTSFICLSFACGSDSPSEVDNGAGGRGGAAGADGAAGNGGGGGAGGESEFTCPDATSDLPGPDDPSVSGIKFRRLASGSFFCGIDDDEGGLHCWSGTGAFDTTPPVGAFHSVAIGHCQACALHVDGDVSCWGCGLGDGGAEPPAGTFSAIAVGTEYICGIGSADGGVRCTGSLENPDEDRAFTEIVAAWDWACGLVDAEGANIVCWGDLPEDPPDVHAIRIGSGNRHACVLDAEGEAHCWGESQVDQTSPPSGPFVRVDGSCAIRPDGVPVCWGGGTLEELHKIPSGCFTEIAASMQACALRSDGRAVCWGHPSYGDPSPP